MKNDFLKHWRVVRYYIKKKYGLSQPDLDIFLFLYSEGRFTKQVFKDYSSIVGWDPARFKRLVDEGWIIVWRKSGWGKSVALYEMSYKGKSLINRIYKILLGEEPIPTTVKHNPLLKKKGGFNERVYRNIIKDIHSGRW